MNAAPNGKARIQITVRPDALTLLDQLCKHEKCTRSEVFEDLLVNWIKRHEDELLHEGIIDHGLRTFRDLHPDLYP